MHPVSSEIMLQPFISAEPSTIKNDPRYPADIGLIGLAVMGQNLVLNLADHGFRVVVYNRTLEKTEAFVHGSGVDAANSGRIFGAYDLVSFVVSLKIPRKIILLVKAGKAVDDFIEKLIPLLEAGDVIIDGGNSLYLDTIRRSKNLESSHSIHFVGLGVSGGEIGARYGPSLMPGGSVDAWPLIREPMLAIAAKAAEDNLPCCSWLGANGSGHFVKMIHNGIEYADMQLICEAYDILRQVLGITNPVELNQIFAAYNNTELNSYLIEITMNIMAFLDPKDGQPLLPKIRDRAGQKGTGKWSVNASLELAVPLTVVSEAVHARCLSALPSEQRLTTNAEKRQPDSSMDKASFVEHIRRALYASKIVSYAQGFMLLREASIENDWNLDFGEIAQIWRAGCIIRSTFLNDIKRAFDTNPKLPNLLASEHFSNEIKKCEESWRYVVISGISKAIPLPCFSSSLAFYDALNAKKLPANLIQAMRDYFGAHTYELDNEPAGIFRHTNWTGEGGNTTASTYDA